MLSSPPHLRCDESKLITKTRTKKGNRTPLFDCPQPLKPLKKKIRGLVATSARPRGGVGVPPVEEVLSQDVSLMEGPVSGGGSHLAAQDTEEEHTLRGEGEPAEEDDNEGHEDELGPVQDGLDSSFEVAHLLPEANKLINLDGDILDLVVELDGDSGLKTSRVPGNQLNILNREGVVDTVELLGGFPLAFLEVTVVEVKEEAVGLLESTLGQGGVTDTASVDGVSVFLVVEDGGSGITTGGG